MAAARMSRERDLHERGFRGRVDGYAIDSAFQQAQELSLPWPVICDYADDFLIPCSRVKAGRLTKMRNQNVDLIDRVRKSKFVLARQR